MMKRYLFVGLWITTTLVMIESFSYSQPPGGFGFGPGGPGMRGPGGPGGPNRQERKLLKQFDTNKNGWLESGERKLARVAAKESEASDDRPEGRPGSGFGGPGFGGPGGRGFGGPGRGGAEPGGAPGPGRGPGGGRASAPAGPGPTVAPDQVAIYPNKSLYDTSVMRTLFLNFENNDWEIELEDFHGTDVDVPATLTVDGKSYENVGVHFRGASSYGHVQRGSKRSFNVSLDLADGDQRLYGYKTLNLLNSHGDPSMMSTVIYSEIARQYIPAPKANFVHVVVNGESWGVYVNAQQFDKTFLKENFGDSKGTRWKVSGNPGADGGLRYLGEEIDEYKTRFEMKSNDGKTEWESLVQLCRILNETPLDQLQTKLDPILDVDATLKFLALDNALVNSDGYWTRASDYSIFRDEQGKFHIVPHDMNEAFALAGRGPGPGGPGRGPGGFGPGGFGPGRDDQRGPRGGFGPPPGLEGRGAEGRGAEGRGAEGRGAEGRGAEGRGGRGRGPGGPGGRGPGGGGPGGGGPGGGGPGGGGPGHGGVDLDPLVGIDSDRMPLRSRLLAIPELRERYMGYVHQIASQSLDWERLKPTVVGHRDLIDPIVKIDTKKLDTYEAFLMATGSDQESGERMSLRKFADQRRAFLLKTR